MSRLASQEERVGGKVIIDRLDLQISVEIGKERVRAIKEMIELHLQPKPTWMPRFLWRYLIKHLLVFKVRRG